MDRPGQRVFNVFIEGQQVLTNFDIYLAAGGRNVPVSLIFTNAVTNSQLQVLFTPVVDNARISGLQSAGRSATWRATRTGSPIGGGSACFGHALGLASDHSRGGQCRRGWRIEP